MLVAVTGQVIRPKNRSSCSDDIRGIPQISP